MRLPRVMRFESFKSQNEVDPDPDPPLLCVSKSELELQELGCERYGRMSGRKRIGSSCSIMNADSNSIVNRDDTGDGIIELDIGDRMKLDNGDLMEPVASEDVSLNEEDAISSPKSAESSPPVLRVTVQTNLARVLKPRIKNSSLHAHSKHHQQCTGSRT